MRRVPALVFAFLLAACSSDPPPATETDTDGDGVSPAEGDCDDTNKDVYAGAPDPCNLRDDNCDGRVDEAYDADRDNVSVCQGDCADNDPDTRPGAVEAIDGRDNDCDGIADNHNDQYDDDGDGFSEDQGDCDDRKTTDHHGEFIGPSALEVQTLMDGTPEGVDNDCDGTVDELAESCEDTLLAHVAGDHARAIGLCERVLRAEFVAPTDARARAIVQDYGTTYVPRSGPVMIGLSSGIVADADESGYAEPQEGTDFGDANTHAHPDPGPGLGCSDPDPTEVNDYAELLLELQVPANAQSFSFDFNFMSAEYPEWVCTEFDDTFLALLQSQAFEGNISFDSQGNPMSINVGFFTVCPVGVTAGCMGSAELAGTGYEGSVGGGTGWLTTTSPVVPGEKVTLRFVIFDEGDHILDSVVLIDNFRWHLEAIEGPITVD